MAHSGNHLTPFLVVFASTSAAEEQKQHFWDQLAYGRTIVSQGSYVHDLHVDGNIPMQMNCCYESLHVQGDILDQLMEHV